MKMIPHLNRWFLLLVLVFGMTSWSVAQVKVDSDQDVGIGTSDTESSKLRVFNENNATSFKINQDYSGGTGKMGINSIINGAGNGYVYGFRNEVNQNANAAIHSSGVRGIFNYITSLSGNLNYGIHNTLTSGGTGDKYGNYTRIFCGLEPMAIGYYLKAFPDVNSTTQIYGSYIYLKNEGTGNQTGLFSWVHPSKGLAGEFRGNVKVYGNLEVTGLIDGTLSDKNFKENIQTLDNSLELIRSLNPKTFNFLLDNNLCLPEGKQYGLIAQEVEEILPDLVKEKRHENLVVPIDPEDSEQNINVEDVKVQAYKTVNYQSLIPILIGAVKEQQKQIEELKETINELKK